MHFLSQTLICTNFNSHYNGINKTRKKGIENMGWYLLNTFELFVGVFFLIASYKLTFKYKRITIGGMYLLLAIVSFYALSWSVEQSGITL